jgi:hypothetical protein
MAEGRGGGFMGRGRGRGRPTPKTYTQVAQQKSRHKTTYEPDLQTVDLSWTSPKPTKDLTGYTIVGKRNEDIDMPQARSRKRTASIEPARNQYDHLDENSETENDADEEDNDALLQIQDDAEIQELRARLLETSPLLIPKLNAEANKITHPADQILNFQQRISRWIDVSTNIETDNQKESQSL